MIQLIIWGYILPIFITLITQYLDYRDYRKYNRTVGGLWRHMKENMAYTKCSIFLPLYNVIVAIILLITFILSFIVDPITEKIRSIKI